MIHNISVHSMHLGFLFQVVSIHVLRKVNKRPATEKLGISGITLFFFKSANIFVFTTKMNKCTLTKKRQIDGGKTHNIIILSDTDRVGVGLFIKGELCWSIRLT